MKIVILGGGLSGCSIAYMLRKKHPDYDITLIEKEKEIGGLCRTFEHGGINYEYGPHILHVHRGKLKDFFDKYLENIEHPFYQFLSVDGKLDDLYNYPVTVEGVIKVNPQAAVELYHINQEKPDSSNLENYIISRVGRTAYEYFFKNYNMKHWGVNPKKIDVEWIRQRGVSLRDHVTTVFGDKWQGHPGDFNPMFDKLTEDINIVNAEVLKYSHCVRDTYGGVETSVGGIEADLFINTVPLDRLFYDDYMFNYRGVTWVYALLDMKKALPTYLTSFPNTYGFTRVMEYKHQSLQEHDKTLLSFSFPFDISDESEPYEKDYQAEALAFIERFFPGKLIDSFVKTKRLVYPIATPENIKLFWHEMDKVSKLDNLITCGRLGLYCYVSMDTCVDQSYQITEVVNKWKGYTPKQRMTFYKQLRERQT